MHINSEETHIMRTKSKRQINWIQALRRLGVHRHSEEACYLYTHNKKVHSVETSNEDTESVDTHREMPYNMDIHRVDTYSEET